MDLNELHKILDLGLTVQINLSKLDQERMVAAVNIIQLGDSKTISTKPFIMKGTPQEIMDNLIPHLKAKEPAIMKSFAVIEEKFDESLKKIAKDNAAPEVKGKTTVPKEAPKKLNAIEEALEKLESLETYDQMKELWIKLKKDSAIAKKMPKEHAEALKTIRTAMIPLEGLWAPAQEKAPEKVIEAVNPPDDEDQTEVEAADDDEDLPNFNEEDTDDELELGKGEDDPLEDNGEEEATETDNPDDPWS